MSDYTPQNEIIDMIFILEECKKNYRTAAKLYRELSRSAHTILRNYFWCARQRQLVKSRAQRGSSETVRLTVLAAIVVNSNINVREISIHGLYSSFNRITDIKEFSLSSVSY